MRRFPARGRDRKTAQPRKWRRTGLDAATSQPLPRFHVLQLHRLGRVAEHLRQHVLPFDIGPVTQGQDNRADHRHQQDQARKLEDQEILGSKYFFYF